VTSALVLGIDTGGTYTDGVLLEYDTRRVLATEKSLTTKHDFSLGIEQVIERIQVEDPGAIRMVSISTTLATNAIAEKKGKRVALLLIGYDPELVSTFRLGARFATPQFEFFKGGHDLYGREKEPLDLPAILAWVNETKNSVDALAISSYFSPLNPEHEQRAQAAIERVCGLPVVLGHQLSTKLGSIERATTAALNASLLAVLQDFIIAVRQAMERRGIDAPLMVVRGDGTLMSDEFAARTPVETIHSGPAASAIGGRLLAGMDDALVVDIGGTTTDFALLRGGQVTISEEGAVAGGYRTSVKAADLLSVGLGGDSRLWIDHDGVLHIGPERVVPLAYLAETHPSVAPRLKALSKRSWSGSSPEWLEYWYLIRAPQSGGLELSQRQARTLELLAENPLPLPELMQRLDVKHAAQLEADTLLQAEWIGRAGITPTDLLHIEGRFERWNRTAAEHALEAFCKFHFLDREAFIGRVWRQMTEMIARSIINFLTRLEFEGDGAAMAEWFFENSLYGTHEELETEIRLRHPMIGIGAPADLLLADTARVLNAELVLPQHFQVANAVGAVGGSVMVEEQVLVYPEFDSAGLDIVGYNVQSSRRRERREELEQALDLAREEATELALGAAIRSGADSPQVSVDERLDGIDTYRVHARAMGNPRLMK
jgi:N-methylhydantoinase A/oxoprolinase/acetone carboxylase beta subunit